MAGDGQRAITAEVFSTERFEESFAFCRGHFRKILFVFSKGLLAAEGFGNLEWVAPFARARHDDAVGRLLPTFAAFDLEAAGFDLKEALTGR